MSASFLLHAIVLGFGLALAVPSTAGVIDLSTWSDESYDAVAGFPIGLWTVAPDNLSVTQVNNGQPTLFYSDFYAFGTDIEGTVAVNTTSDDDLIGFALGFHPGDAEPGNPNADYLLVDWKQTSQFYNFSDTCASGGLASAGLAVSRVSGVPSADELWGHYDCNDADGAVYELQRGITLGDKGWSDLRQYVFTFQFSSSNLKVFVDGVLEIDVAGNFSDGRLAFYNFSQGNVTYSGFDLLPLPEGWLGESLQTAPNYEFSADQGDLVTDYIYLYNKSNEERTAALAVLNPHPDLTVSPQSQESVTVSPAETVTVPLTIDAGEAAIGLYDGILLEVSVDDGSTVYSNLEVAVTDPDAPPLPDLEVTTADVSAVNDEVAGTTRVQALVHNRGSAAAANVEVTFYEFGILLDDTTLIPEIPAGGTASALLDIPITNDGDHLFRVVVDPNGSIAEGDEANNEASVVVSWNTPAATEGLILVTGSLPSTVYAGSLFAVAGKAVYELYIDGERNIEYVVKGGSVEVTIKAEDDNEWLYGGIYTNVNGDFRKSLLAPTEPGTYRVLMTVSDKTFIGNRELVVTVEEPPAEDPAPPSPPTASGEGYWSYDEVTGDWTWLWITLPVGEPILDSDLWVHSEDIYFSDTHPDTDEEITVVAELQYWATRTSLLAEDIPVNLYAIDPGTASRELIGRTIIPSLSVGAPDYGSRYVFATWRNRGDGIYLIETEIDPSYQEENLLNNAATRAILVGDWLPSGQGAVAGQVISPWGGVENVIVGVYEFDGTLLASTVTDATGYYLASNIPVDEYEVRIEVPAGYAADPTFKFVSVENQALSSANFALTLACTAPEAPTGLKASLTRQYVFLRWSASEEAEEYIIYRRVDNQDPFEVIGTLSATTFRDRDHGMGDDFNLLEYYVVAKNDCGASAPSDVATVRPKGPR